MRTIMILRGLPGCGKSTFAKELLKKEPDRWKRINRDDLRGMIDDGEFSPTKEEFIRSIESQLIRSAVRDGFDVILDNTNLVPTTVKRVHNLAEGLGDIKIIEKGFNVSIEDCHKRNQLRTGRARVPDDVINKMAHSSGLDKKRKLEDKESYYPPLFVKAEYAQDEKLQKAIICDLDGTLALMNGRSPYDASTCENDLPNTPVIECVKAMFLQGYKIIFMSGREDKYREPTLKFIQRYCQVPAKWAFPMENDNRPQTHVIPFELYMRSSGDMRKDQIIKRELFDANVNGKYFIQFVLDDRDQVVRGWRNDIGLTVFQVAPGDF